MAKIFYQINIFQQKEFINQFDINVFINIKPIIEDINISFRSFKEACEFQQESEIRDKAIAVLSRYRLILEQKREFFHALQNKYGEDNDGISNKNHLDLSIIDTGLTLLNEFNSKSQLFDKDKKIVNALYSDIKELYLSTIGTSLNKDFWYELQRYEFLLKEKVISNNSDISRYNFNFSDNELEEFFLQNRFTILSELWNLKYIYSPLENPKFQRFYEMHKKVMSFTMKVLIE